MVSVSHGPNMVTFGRRVVRYFLYCAASPGLMVGILYVTALTSAYAWSFLILTLDLC